MSRIRLSIDRLVLNGFGPLEAKAVAEALQSRLSDALADPASRDAWARSHRTPILKLGRMPLEPGTAGARQLGTKIGQAVGKGLTP
jgi:hypothetical protein